MHVQMRASEEITACKQTGRLWLCVCVCVYVCGTLIPNDEERAKYSRMMAEPCDMQRKHTAANESMGHTVWFGAYIYTATRVIHAHFIMMK
jgi:hypothetical protein